MKYFIDIYFIGGGNLSTRFNNKKMRDRSYKKFVKAENGRSNGIRSLTIGSALVFSKNVNYIICVDK